MLVKAMPSADFLYVKAAGKFSLDDATRTFAMVIDLVEANHSSKVLYDGREVEGNPTAVERYYYAAFAADAVNLLHEHGWVMDPPRFAYVLKAPMLDPERLGQIVARKRDMKVKAFEKLDEAISWLRLEPNAVKHLTEDPRDVIHLSQ